MQALLNTKLVLELAEQTPSIETVNLFMAAATVWYEPSKCDAKRHPDTSYPSLEMLKNASVVITYLKVFQ